MRVLVLTGGYLPGYRYGGPVRSVAAIVDHLGSEIDFSIVTTNHDLGDPTPYQDVKSDTWTQVGKATVWYTASERLSLRLWRKVLADRNPDVIYVNSFFSPSTVATLLLLRCGVLPRLPVLIAPRGEFSMGALGLKSGKKRVYISFARRLGMLSRVAWHVSSASEVEDLRRAIPEAKSVHIAPNLLSAIRGEPKEAIEKQPGEVKLVYIARISPKKNLLGAIQYLQSQSGRITFDVYGPLEDQEYWASCLAAVAQLPENVKFSYCGELPHHTVAETLRRYHFIFLPTLGENFGHSIAEALQQGCPVLISDQTPWRNLEDAGVGWDLSLNEPSSWPQALDACVGMENDTYQEMSQRCRGFAEKWVADQGGIEANLRMFQSVAASSSS